MRKALVPLLLLVLLTISSCARPPVIQFSGEAQGTTYHIKAMASSCKRERDDLQRRIEQRLGEIDLALSNYRDDSELSRLNRAPVGKWVDLNRDLYAVLKASEQISQISEGRFDVTVAPLVNLWGFGPIKKAEVIPSDTEIAPAKATIDYRYLELDISTARVRKKRELEIDVNAIAQGYTVDQLADVLSAAGCADFMAEVGGELRLAGRNPDNKLWQIGIEKPSEDLIGAQEVLAVTGVGVTTAGDYREYFEKDGQRYSHTIDPRTGRPITHRLASVTVIATSATLADGYDTVLEVMGPEEGFRFAEQHDLAAYFIVREGDHFVTRYTQQMSQYLNIR